MPHRIKIVHCKRLHRRSKKSWQCSKANSSSTKLSWSKLIKSSIYSRPKQL